MLAAGVQRSLALAAVALLAAVGIFAGRSRVERASSTTLPQQVPAPGGGWYDALASSRGPAFSGEGRSNCGHRLGPRSMGIAHPVLACDAKVWIRFGDELVLTQVLVQGPRAPGYDFELTSALAQRIGLQGVQSIRWRFAGD